MAVTAPPEQDTAAVPRTPRRIAFNQTLSRWDVKVSPYLYVSPFFIIFLLVGLFPLAYTAYVSVHNWHLIGGKGEFVGLDNYTRVLGQPLFWKGLRNTFSIFIISAVPQVLLGLVLAAMLDANLRAKTFWRMGVLLPYVVAPVAVGLIFSKLFADKSGMINALLEKVGLPAVAWHADVLASHVAIATMVNFRWTGYTTLILLAGMQAVPRDVYEAAAIDGASRIRTFFSVTIPMIRPTLIFVVITSTIGGLQIFDEPRMFDQAGQGGSDRQWMTTTMYLYQLGWGPLKSFGMASAVAWILFLVIIAIGIVNFLITRRISATDSLSEGRRLMTSAPMAGQTAGKGAARYAARRAARKAEEHNSGRRPGWVTYLILGASLALFAYPLYYTFLLASSDAVTIAQNPIPSMIPGGQFLENVQRVLSADIDLVQAGINSLIVAVVTSVSVVFFATLAGFSFAKLKFRGRKALLLFVIATMAVPTQLGVVPLFILMSEIGWTGKLVAVIVPGMVTAFGVFWMTQYFEESLPTELIEAARVDGCSMIRTFWNVALPAARPAAAMLALFTFVASWTNFFWPFIVLGSSNPTLPVALQLLQASYFKDYSLIMAGVTLATIPLILLFFVAGKQLVSGIMAGAVKG